MITTVKLHLIFNENNCKDEKTMKTHSNSKNFDYEQFNARLWKDSMLIIRQKDWANQNYLFHFMKCLTFTPMRQNHLGEKDTVCSPTVCPLLRIKIFTKQKMRSSSLQQSYCFWRLFILFLRYHILYAITEIALPEMKADKANSMLTVMPPTLGEDVAPKTKSASQEHRDNAANVDQWALCIFQDFACWQHDKSRQ